MGWMAKYSAALGASYLVRPIWLIWVANYSLLVMIQIVRLGGFLTLRHEVVLLVQDIVSHATEVRKLHVSVEVHLDDTV
jgi:hypothetical protein